MSLSVIHYPHPTLRHVSRPLKRVDAELKRWIAQMFDLMYEFDGVGLAANQVDLPYRLFVANVEGDRTAADAECVFINPVILRSSGQAEREEGCLSIPGVYAPVQRKERVTVQAYNLAGEEVSGDFEGLFARVVQHEIDHLDGRLFIDRIAPLERADISGQLEEFELDFQSKRAVGEMPSDQQIAARIAELERQRT
ncbi:MAG TPA: peptide deformylase [Lacipirellulaceae bacterium]|nr:peptide deformylase [Lacipirellulaceae bacterium]